MFVFGQFNYTIESGFYAFLLPILLNFQGSAHLFGVGSFSSLPLAYSPIYNIHCFMCILWHTFPIFAIVDGKTVSTCLLESRMVKAHKRHDNWTVCNCLKKQVELFKQLNTPLEVALSLHT